MVNKKRFTGFTIIELLASIIILSILIGIGIASYQGVTNRVDTSYYEAMEADLLLAGNEYFTNNREDKPLEGYNSVDIVDLIDKKYIETLKDRNGKVCENIDDENSRVYIYKTDTGYDYETCLVCSEYRSTGKYCQGVVEKIINISATSNNKPYNVLLSYANTSWTKANVNVTFKMTNSVSRYDIVNLSNNEKTSCTSISNNSCTKEISKGSSYRVIAIYNDEEIARSNFNLKIDKIKPTVVYTKEGGYYQATSLSLDVKPADDLLVKDYDVLVNNGGTSTTIASHNNQKDSKLTINLNGEGSYDVLTQVRDMAGNVNAASSSDTIYNKYYQKRYILDKTAPVCTLTPSSNSVNVGESISVKVVCNDAHPFNNPPTLATNKFSVSSSSVLKVTAVSGPTNVTGGIQYTVTVKGLAVGSSNVKLNANAIQDNANNANTSSSSSNITVKNPVVCKYRYNLTYGCPCSSSDPNCDEDHTFGPFHTSSGYVYDSSTAALNACNKARPCAGAVVHSCGFAVNCS